MLVTIYGDVVNGMVAATRMNPIRPIQHVAPDELGLGYGPSNTPLQEGWAMREEPLTLLA